jgi:hypothetical protein
MSESSIITIALSVNALLMAALGFWFRRWLGDNDKVHGELVKAIQDLRSDVGDKLETERNRQVEDDKDLEDKLSRLIDALSAEKDARVNDIKAEGEKLWKLREELSHDYASRRESMRQYGTLLQAINRLPCHRPSCPTSEA